MWCTTVAVEILRHVHQCFQNVVCIAIAVRVCSIPIGASLIKSGVCLRSVEQYLSGTFERGIQGSRRVLLC